jgi:hypothetical protein
MWPLSQSPRSQTISIVFPNRSILYSAKHLNSFGTCSVEDDDIRTIDRSIRDDMPFRYVSEQVSHHPPVSAFQCESKDNGTSWRFYGSILPKAKFSVKNMEVNPKGLLTLELRKWAMKRARTFIFL